MVIVGLGNIGAGYVGTRHNVGVQVIEHLATRHFRGKHWKINAYFKAYEVDGLVLVRSMQFMNTSGPVIARVLVDYNAAPDDLILTYDDIDLPLGMVRIRMGGGSGGHRGVTSIQEALGVNDIRRVKIGIGKPERKEDISSYVLSKFTPEEFTIIERAVTEAALQILKLARHSRDLSSGRLL